jgi:hypothetical protein
MTQSVGSITAVYSPENCCERGTRGDLRELNMTNREVLERSLLLPSASYVIAYLTPQSNLKESLFKFRIPSSESKTQN